MNTTETNPQADRSADDTQTSSSPGGGYHHTLCRPHRDRMLAGVAAGIADYLGADVLIVRIAFAVLALVGGAGLPAYLACWLLIPAEGSEYSLASELIHSLSARSL
jgi:phage shock protein PspC (stress-responsive transcriptional regulator)